MRTVYPLGFILALLTHIFVCMFNWEYSYSLGVPEASFTAFIGAAVIGVLIRFIPENSNMQNLTAWTAAGAGVFWNWTRRLLNMEWLLSLIRSVFNIVSTAVETASGLLESPSGLIWELLILAMLTAAIFGSGVV